MQYFDKSAVAQHVLENNHHIGFDETRLIDRARNYWDRIRRETIESKLQPNNFNRDIGLHISKAWSPAISALRRLRARGQHSTSAPALATLGVDHSVPDVGKAHSDWIQLNSIGSFLGELLHPNSSYIILGVQLRLKPVKGTFPLLSRWGKPKIKDSGMRRN